MGIVAMTPGLYTIVVEAAVQSGHFFSVPYTGTYVNTSFKGTKHAPFPVWRFVAGSYNGAHGLQTGTWIFRTDMSCDWDPSKPTPAGAKCQCWQNGRGPLAFWDGGHAAGTPKDSELFDFDQQMTGGPYTVRNYRSSDNTSWFMTYDADHDLFKFVQNATNNAFLVMVRILPVP